MNKKYLFSFLFFFISMGFLNTVSSQKITNVNANVQGNAMNISYKISSWKFEQKYLVSLFVSFDGGQTYKGPMQSISGDVEIDNTAGTKNIVWNIFNDVKSLEGDVVFDVRANLVDKPKDKDFFIQYSGGILLSSVNYTAPFGFFIGSLGNIGWYVSGRFNSFVTSDYTYSNGEVQEDILYETTSEKLYPNMMFTAGLTQQVGTNMFLYAGMGFGIKKYYLGIEETDKNNLLLISKKWVNVIDFEEKGLELELGTIIKVNRLCLSVGISTLNMKQIGINSGIGIIF